MCGTIQGYNDIIEDVEFSLNILLKENLITYEQTQYFKRRLKSLNEYENKKVKSKLYKQSYIHFKLKEMFN